MRYVITLDTDTQLPRDAARKFVATMAHPLNRPRLGGRPESPRVVGGYGILQPRVGVSLAAASRTRYGRLFGGDAGIDPYTRAVSDVYQDLFGEGSFIGKGIYDVDAFEHVLGGRLPENRVLSHDLLEGGYARSGLISDVELVEESPSRYDADVKRRHRWIRGDWQIAAWLLPRVPTTVSEPGRDMPRMVRAANPLSRAVAPEDPRQPAAQPRAGVRSTMLLLLGWAVLAQPVAVDAGACWRPCSCRCCWASSATCCASPIALGWRAQLSAAGGGSAAAVHARGGLARDAALRGVVQPRCRSCARCGACLSRAGACSSGSRLPPWRGGSAADAAGDFAADGPAHGVRAGARSRARPCCSLSGGPKRCPLRCRCCCCGPHRRPSSGGSTSRSRCASRPINEAQALYLRLLARRTWAFFETFVGPQDNHLPPDNVQEHPVERIAHRTSPTNIGLSLLATLTARDFGYVTTGQLIERTDGDARHDGAHGAPPRALVQLVRHADAAAAAPGLRVVGGQRQPGRPPADAACRPCS